MDSSCSVGIPGILVELAAAVRTVSLASGLWHCRAFAAGLF